MREAHFSTRFVRDIRLAEKRRKDISKLRRVITLLVSNMPLPEMLLDHPLKGRWAGHRDLHLEPDWVLIYRIDGDIIHLERMGTHSDLFGR